MKSIIAITKAIAIAAIVSILCLLPPVIHFVTGPLGPAIGGYIAGNRARLTAGQSAMLGLILGIIVGVPAPVALEETGILPDLSPLVIIFFAALAAVYVGLLSGAAAAFGGNAAREEDAAGTDDDANRHSAA